MTTKKTAAERSADRSRLRADLRKSVIAAGAESQKVTIRERGRQRRSVEKTKTTQRVVERQQSESARVSAYQERSNIAIAQREASRKVRVGTQSDINALSRREKVITGATKSVTKTSVWSTLIMLTGLFFFMIIIYVIVTNGSKFGDFTGGVGSFISGLSSTKPLFVKKAVEGNDPATTAAKKEVSLSDSA